VSPVTRKTPSKADKRISASPTKNNNKITTSLLSTPREQKLAISSSVITSKVITICILLSHFHNRANMVPVNNNSKRISWWLIFATCKVTSGESRKSSQKILRMLLLQRNR